jgi:transposase
VPRATIVEISPPEQAQMLAAVRRARYGYLLALHILLLSAAQRSPTEIAAVLFCSRSTVYRVVQAYRAGQWDEFSAQDVSEQSAPQRQTLLSPTLRRSVLGILHSAPRLCGWCRTRWSCATVALELCVRRRSSVSGETVRRWLHELGWEWKRAKFRAKDDDPGRVEKLARIRRACEQLRAGVALFFADELDINLLPKVGYQWMPKGEQVEVLTPGTNEKRYLAGALDMTTGKITHCVWYRKQTGLFLDLLETLDRTHPAPLYTQVIFRKEGTQI